MSDKPSSWSRPPLSSTDRADAMSSATKIVTDAREQAAQIGVKAIASVRPVATSVGARVREGLDKVGDALRTDGGDSASPELLSQADLPELQSGDALLSLAVRLDREADFWRGVAMRQLARAAWTERLGVSGSLLLLIGSVVLAAIAAFRALFATAGGTATAMLVGVGLAVLLVAAVAVGKLAHDLRKGQLEAVREALVRSDLAEVRLHRIALLMEMRAGATDGYTAALSELEADVRRS